MWKLFTSFTWSYFLSFILSFLVHFLFIFLLASLISIATFHSVMVLQFVDLFLFIFHNRQRQLLISKKNARVVSCWTLTQNYERHESTHTLTKSNTTIKIKRDKQMDRKNRCTRHWERKIEWERISNWNILNTTKETKSIYGIGTTSERTEMNSSVFLFYKLQSEDFFRPIQAREVRERVKKALTHN